MTVNEYLAKFRAPKSIYPLVPRIECHDGFSISVQANAAAYCSPRDNDGPWNKVECGFPSDIPTEIMDYVEDSDEPTQTVYGYVPIEYVEKLIESHGGIKEKVEENK